MRSAPPHIRARACGGADRIVRCASAGAQLRVSDTEDVTCARFSADQNKSDTPAVKRPASREVTVTRILKLLFAALFVVALSAPAPALAHGHGGFHGGGFHGGFHSHVFFGFGCCGFGPYYPAYYP